MATPPLDLSRLRTSTGVKSRRKDHSGGKEPKKVFLKDREGLKQDIAELRSDIAELESLKQELSTKLCEADSKLTSARASLQQNKARMAIAREGIAVDPNSAPKDLSKSNDPLLVQNRIAQLKIANSALQQRVEAAKRQSVEQQAEADQLEQQLEDAQRALSQTPVQEQQSLEQLKGELHMLRDEQRAAARHTAAARKLLTRERKDSEQALEVATSRLRRLDKALAAARDDLRHWERQQRAELARIRPVEEARRESARELRRFYNGHGLLRLAFDRFDSSGDGVLAPPELLKALKVAKHLEREYPVTGEQQQPDAQRGSEGGGGSDDEWPDVSAVAQYAREQDGEGEEEELLSFQQFIDAFYHFVKGSKEAAAGGQRHAVGDSVGGEAESKQRAGGVLPEGEGGGGGASEN